jgi:dolichol-phosphate mannosyltransferase
LHYIITIRITELKRVIKFGIVGAIGFIVNFTALEVFYKGFNIPPHIAAAMGAELAIISNFIFNNVWTFKERKITKSTRLIQKFIQFNLASLGAIAIQYIGVWLGTQIAGEAYYQIYFVASVGVSTVVNFVIYNTIIWNK